MQKYVWKCGCLSLSESKPFLQLWKHFVTCRCSELLKNWEVPKGFKPKLQGYCYSCTFPIGSTSPLFIGFHLFFMSKVIRFYSLSSLSTPFSTLFPFLWLFSQFWTRPGFIKGIGSNPFCLWVLFTTKKIGGWAMSQPQISLLVDFFCWQNHELFITRATRVPGLLASINRFST